MVVERQTHGIEAGAEVGGRGGHAHVIKSQSMASAVCALTSRITE